MDGVIPFVTDPRSCLDPARARSAPCAYGEGDACQCCPANARCPGGARAWPERGFWSSSEASTFVEMCEPPQMKRCLGMVHGSMSGGQCGTGYQGRRCQRCDAAYYSNPVTGACLACSSSLDSSSNGPAISLELIAPLLWLALGLALSFLAVFAAVFFIQRQQGGTLMGGLSRSIDFACYLIILLQTTLYIANDAVKSTTDVVLDRFADTDAGTFIRSFFEGVSVLQLDFSQSVRLPCLGGDPATFEHTYAALTCILVVVYVAVLLVLPRLAVGQRVLMAKAHSGGTRLSTRISTRISTVISASNANTETLLYNLYGQFTYRVGVWLVLTHAVSCKVALSNMYCADEGGVGDDTPLGGASNGVNSTVNGSGKWGGEPDTGGCTATARNPAWVVLLLVHGIAFPLAICLGAFFVRKRFLGGTCCNDTNATIETQKADTRANGELGLWRYYLDYDFKGTHFSVSNFSI